MQNYGYMGYAQSGISFGRKSSLAQPLPSVQPTHSNYGYNVYGSTAWKDQVQHPAPWYLPNQESKSKRAIKAWHVAAALLVFLCIAGIIAASVFMAQEFGKEDTVDVTALVRINVEITMEDEDFNEELFDLSLPEAVTMGNLVCSRVRRIFVGTDLIGLYKTCVVHQFSPGSVQADLAVFLEETIPFKKREETSRKDLQEYVSAERVQVERKATNYINANALTIVGISAFRIVSSEITAFEIGDDACTELDCGSNGDCDSVGFVARCKCNAHYTGPTCQVKDPCLDTQCLNGGTCKRTGLESAECLCTEAWEGELCQEERGPCSSSPCQNGGTCIELNDQEYNCTCPLAYVGEHCETNKLTIFNNPADNNVFSTTTDDGSTITAIGNKDENGVVTDIETFEYVDPSGNTTTVKLGNDSLINQVITDTAVLVYDWILDDDGGLLGVHISAIAKKGLLRASVNVDLTSNTTDTQKRKKRSVDKFKFNPIKSVLNRVKRQSPSVVRVPIDVKRCGELSDASDVKARVLFEYEETLTGVKWGQNSVFNANPLPGVGKYEIQIPNKPASDVPEVVSAICDGVNTALGHICTGLSFMPQFLRLRVCIGIAAAIDLITAAVPGDSILILRVCKKAFKVADIVCKTLDTSLLPDGPTLMDHICEKSSQLVDNVINSGSSIFVIARARFPDSTSISNDGIKFDIPAGAHTTAIIVLEDAEQVFIVESLYAIPSDPGPGESYVVYFYYKCGLEGNEVWMHIIGTDGYVDELTCPAVNDCNCCLLHVPGADALVRDIVTVRYNDAGGTALYSSQLVLVF